MSARIFLSLLSCLLLTSVACADEYKSGIQWPEPEVVTPGEKPSDPPSDATVLFDGTDMSQWEGGDAWIVEEGTVTAAKRTIQTKEKFGDVQLHLEWAAPEKIEGTGQGRGNSGVYLMGRYEVQILDSYDNETYFDGQAASIYKQTPPMVNAMKKPGEWNTYDIIFNAPRFNEDGSVKKPASITVLHNGVLVQNHFELLGGTFWDEPPHYEKHEEKGPIHLQFHGNPVKFRNIWVREIRPIQPLDQPENSSEEMAPAPADAS